MPPYQSRLVVLEALESSLSWLAPDTLPSKLENHVTTA
jgi:hypothetical protein